MAAPAAIIYISNASWPVAPPRDREVKLIAHRGIHQTYHREGLDSNTCTAERIYPPLHDYIENTIRSMHAAIEAGADIVELDVHPTTNGRFAVLHDWTVDCWTNGTGETRRRSMTYLQSLDVGHGYTADGGRSFPLRGKGLGLMPELTEVFEAIPDGRFLINFKSREAREGDMLSSLVDQRPDQRSRVWGDYGGDEPTSRAAELMGHVKAWSRRTPMNCLSGYAALGWTGFMPDPCRNTAVMIPLNVAPWLWGWPNRLLHRFAAAGSEVILVGPHESGDPGAAGIDTLEQLDQLLPQFSGYLWTNKIEVIGPAMDRR